MSTTNLQTASPQPPRLRMVSSQEASPATFDAGAVRRALGSFATGVTVVTTVATDGKPVGLTANSFTSVSMDPPLVLWCLASKSPNLQAFRDAGHFAINILHAEQRDLCKRFSDPRIADRFDGVQWRSGKLGMPVLEGCVANFECRHWSEHEAGDHVVFIGRLEHIDYVEGEPLVFSQGKLGNFHH